MLSLKMLITYRLIIVKCKTKICVNKLAARTRLATLLELPAHSLKLFAFFNHVKL